MIHSNTITKIKNEPNFSWQQVLPVLSGLWLLIIFMYRETGLAMVQIWARSDTFAHAFLVLPISVWLIWRKREQLTCVTPRVEFIPLSILVLIAILWLISTLASVNSLTQVSLVAMLVLTVPAMLGWRVTNIILFPLGFLFFSVPLGEFLMPQLMEWTADVTVLALRSSGIPVYREGLQFIISSGHWSVVEACSGIRYLIASLTVGTLFAYLSFTSFKKRVLFILLSILVPVVANWMRAYLIVLLGHISGNKIATGVDHLIYGWVFFGVIIFSMFAIGIRWSEPSYSVKPETELFSAQLPVDSKLKILTVAFIFSLLVFVPLHAYSRFDISASVPITKLSLPKNLGAVWQVSDEQSLAFKPAYQIPDSEVNKIYSTKNKSVGIYIGWYKHQTSTRKLVSSSNVLVTSQDTHWSQLVQGVFPMVLNDAELVVKTATLQRSAVLGSSNLERILVWKIYWIGGLLTTNDYLAKVYAVWRRLTGDDDDSAVIILYTNDKGNTQAQATLATFLTDNYDSINSVLLAHTNNDVHSVTP